ncbi:RNA degradosome polyphosphate kinase [Anaeromicropila herbilytica]|uniref:Polyphosphate kinase n=1 Tax=Anaeromicropila herbilytica TaxID=2785025 RepID=A0A7R7EK57_9FIRM|nr:RNA degradosome polyphosphate kinase [Anaeromicropila herbilytica]BCN30356.1 RNA degradosome polyphosphate kinase [Anaeromicropila herbilytica]
MANDNKSEFNKPEYFTNRELSWIDFNYRVLGEAKDKSNPLFERLKFLSITASNLDEFFMIRIASLKDMVNAGYTKKDIAGLNPEQQLKIISEKAHEFVNTQYNTYNRSLLPLLKNQNITIVPHYENLTDIQSKYVDDYFMNDVYPVLTPMAVDSSRPFPLIRNKTLNIGALIREEKDSEEYDFATVQVPNVLPRIVPIPSSKDSDITFILLEQIIEKNIHKLFLNYEVICAYPYRIMRNADLSIDEDEAADLLKEIQKQLKKRQWGEVIRLDVEDNIDKRLLKILKKELHVKDHDILKMNGPLDFTFLMKLFSLDGFDHLKHTKYIPQPVKDLNHEEDLFTQIRRKDILLHHPYQTFDPVVDFVKQAALDPNVLAIKQTLYRVSGNSPIITALADAAENGKQVSVLVELKARFDEENNINWAKKLEQSGCHVIYGLLGLKTHSKITLVVRKEDDGIRRYVHLGTGNYNDSTAKLYTDLGLLTCSKPIGEDATAVFNMLSGYSEPLTWNKLSLAPLWLRDKFLELIHRETEHARNGKKGHIIAKMNSLCDKSIISALYEASNAGVKIELIIRGICSVKVGIPTISENITVRSIVGNFLEHSRIFYFLNGGYEEVYLGSSDWMPRNLDKRVEILFPVEAQSLKAEIIDILKIELKDTVKAHVLTAEDTYEKVDKRGKKALDSQEYFCQKAIKEASTSDDVYNKRVFEPLIHEE